MTKIKLAIDFSGLKQVYIARKLNINYSLMNRYVSGERKAPEEFTRQLAKLLKVPLSSIVEEEQR